MRRCSPKMMSFDHNFFTVTAQGRIICSCTNWYFRLIFQESFIGYFGVGNMNTLHDGLEVLVPTWFYWYLWQVSDLILHSTSLYQEGSLSDVSQSTRLPCIVCSLSLHLFYMPLWWLSSVLHQCLWQVLLFPHNPALPGLMLQLSFLNFPMHELKITSNNLCNRIGKLFQRTSGSLHLHSHTFGWLLDMLYPPG